MLGIYLFFLSKKYANVESVMSQWPFVTLVGILMIFYLSREKSENKTLKNKYKLLCSGYPIILIISGGLIFTSIPVYSYKEALQIIENQTGEKIIKTKGFKASNRFYYIYTKDKTYLVNPYDGKFYLKDG